MNTLSENEPISLHWQKANPIEGSNYHPNKLQEIKHVRRQISLVCTFQFILTLSIHSKGTGHKRRCDCIYHTEWGTLRNSLFKYLRHSSFTFKWVCVCETNFDVQMDKELVCTLSECCDDIIVSELCREIWGSLGWESIQHWPNYIVRPWYPANRMSVDIWKIDYLNCLL